MVYISVLATTILYLEGQDSRGRIGLPLPILLFLLFYFLPFDPGTGVATVQLKKMVCPAVKEIMKKNTPLILFLALLAGGVFAQPRSGQPVQEERLRYNQLLQRTRAAVSDCDSDLARRLLRQAEEKDSAIRDLQRRNDRKALRAHYADATRLLLRALDLCSEKRSSGGEEIDREFAQLEQRIDRAGSPERPRSRGGRGGDIGKIKALQSQTRRALDAGQVDLARRKMDMIRLLLNRPDEPAPSGDRSSQALRGLREEIDRLYNSPEGGSPRMRSMLQAAAEQAEDAERFLQRRRIVPARAAIAAGNRLLARAASPANRRDDPSATDLQAEVTFIGEMLYVLESERNADPARREEIRLCRTAYQKGERALKNGQPGIAHEYFLLAKDLLTELTL